MTNNPPPNNDDAGEFAAFHGRNDMLAAYLFAKHGGEAMLREVFRTDGTFARESLEDIAVELEGRKLLEPAKIMRDIAAECESGLTLHNPFVEGETYVGANGVEYPNHNWSEWRRYWLLHRRERTGELRKIPLQHRAQKQRQTQAQQAKTSHTRH